MKRTKILALSVPALLVILADQLTKYIIRTSPDLHRVDLIEGWLEFYYTQNSGMAMGISILSTEVVSLISITATIGITTYILMNMSKAPIGYLIFMGLVLGGAVGNIIDRFTMGFIGGYGGLLQGHVVDFIHFDLRIGDWAVFPYIFNVADIAISVSIISLLIFHKKLMPEELPEEDMGTEKSVS